MRWPSSRRASARCSALVAEGRTNAGIAKQLWLTEKTVETHVSSILGKLDLPQGGDGAPARARGAHVPARIRGLASDLGDREHFDRDARTQRHVPGELERLVAALDVDDVEAADAPPSSRRTGRRSRSDSRPVAHDRRPRRSSASPRRRRPLAEHRRVRHVLADDPRRSSLGQRGLGLGSRRAAGTGTSSLSFRGRSSRRRMRAHGLDVCSRQDGEHRRPSRRTARGAARGGASSANGAARHVLAEGLHPAHDALPRRVRLLHVRAASATRRAGIHDGGGGARDRARRRGGRLPRGALHARRQAGAALQGRARGAARARLRDDARVPRALRAARARGDGPAAAPQSRGHDARGAGSAAAGLGLDGDHARDDGRAARREGRPALGLAGQDPDAASRDDPPRGRARDPVHERDPHRDRRDARGADRRPPRPEGARRGARAPPGGHRPELPREARDADGLARGAVARRPPLDDRGRAHPARPGVARAGAAESRLRRLPASPRRRHRRLGRRLAGDDRPREPGGALARARAARRGDALARARARAAVARLSRVRRRAVARSGRAAVRAPSVRRDGPRARRRVGARRARRRAVRRPPRRASARAQRSASSARTRSRGSSRHAGRRRRACSRRPTRCDARSAATRSRYVVTRNIQYTNVCYFRCGFCAFSKGKLAANLRGAPYLVPREEIVRRAQEAWERGATEVCLQGGIHPAFTGDYYADVVRAIKQAVPEIHVHAFSALEVWQGAATLDLSLEQYLGAPARPRARLAPGDGRRGARRRGAARHLSRQGDDRAVARRPRRGASRRAALERHAHVRACRHAALVGASLPACSRAAAALRRVHRVRPAAVRADGGADLHPGARAARADVPRDAARPRGRAARAASGDHEHPGVVGEARPGRHAPGARAPG